MLSTGYIHNGVAIDGNELVEGLGTYRKNGPDVNYYTGESVGAYNNGDTTNYVNGIDNAQFAFNRISTNGRWGCRSV